MAQNQNDGGYIRIGLITKVHGVRGEVLVKPLTNDPRRFELLKHVYVEKQATGEQSELASDIIKPDIFEIENVRFQKDRLLIKFRGYIDADSVIPLKGRYISISEKDLVQLPDNSYFVFDIIGCEVFNLSGEAFGVVRDVLQTGGNDVYVVAPRENKKSPEVLIPAVKSIIKDVSVRDKVIIVDFSASQVMSYDGLLLQPDI